MNQILVRGWILAPLGDVTINNVDATAMRAGRAIGVRARYVGDAPLRLRRDDGAEHYLIDRGYGDIRPEIKSTIAERGRRSEVDCTGFQIHKADVDLPLGADARLAELRLIRVLGRVTHGRRCAPGDSAVRRADDRN